VSNSIVDTASEYHATSYDSGDTNASNQFEGSDDSYGEYTQVWQAAEDGQWEGDTEASSRSFLSQVELYRIESNELQLEGHVMEIPFRELDDPPDGRMEAASLGQDSEIEHGGGIG